MKYFYRMKLHNLVVIFLFILLVSCSNSSDSGKGKKPVYVKPSVDYKGKYRKGHIRMPVSTKNNAIKSQNRSKYYYKTKGKFRRKKK
jgi:hypothetical protein